MVRDVVQHILYNKGQDYQGFIHDNLCSEGLMRYTILYLFLGFFTLYAITSPGVINVSDGESRFRVALSIVERGQVDVDSDIRDLEGFFTKGSDGKNYCNYNLGQSLIMSPFVMFGKLIESKLPPEYGKRKDRIIISSLIALICFPLFATGAVVMFYLCMLELGRSPRASLVTSIVYGAATIVWPYASSSFEENIIAFLTLVGFFYYLRGSNRAKYTSAIMAGFFIGFAILVRVSVVVQATILFMGYLFRIYLQIKFGKDKWKHYALEISCFLISAILTGGGTFIYNYIKTGNVFETGYNLNQVLNGNPIVGFYAMLISPGEGIVWYVPVILLSLITAPRVIKTKNCNEIIAYVIFIGVMIFYSFFFGWGAEMAWGPRFLASAVPFLLLPIGILFDENKCWSKKKKFPIYILIFFSVLIQILGIAMPHDTEFYPIFARRLKSGNQAAMLPREYPLLLYRARNVAWVLLRYAHQEEIANKMIPLTDRKILEKEDNYHNIFIWPIKCSYSKNIRLFSPWMSILILAGGSFMVGMFIKTAFRSLSTQEFQNLI